MLFDFDCVNRIFIAKKIFSSVKKSSVANNKLVWEGGNRYPHTVTLKTLRHKGKVYVDSSKVSVELMNKKYDINLFDCEYPVD